MSPAFVADVLSADDSRARVSRGAGVYAMTWGNDGGYRSISQDGGHATFGGALADAPNALDGALFELR